MICWAFQNTMHTGVRAITVQTLICHWGIPCGLLGSALKCTCHFIDQTFYVFGWKSWQDSASINFVNWWQTVDVFPVAKVQEEVLFPFGLNESLPQFAAGKKQVILVMRRNLNPPFLIYLPSQFTQVVVQASCWATTMVRLPIMCGCYSEKGFDRGRVGTEKKPVSHQESILDQHYLGIPKFRQGLDGNGWVSTDALAEHRIGNGWAELICVLATNGYQGGGIKCLGINSHMLTMWILAMTSCGICCSFRSRLCASASLSLVLPNLGGPL